MEQISLAIRKMIEISDIELEGFLNRCTIKKFKRHEIVSRLGVVPNEILFITNGLIRIIISDNNGIEHSLHFALQDQFIADYSAFILKQVSFYTLRTEEETEAVLIPRETIEWGYNNLKQGDRLGRLIAEFYFIYQDNRLKNLYTRTPQDRYNNIATIFPDIHNRVPQYMIASYLGITPVHLSRLKKAGLKKS